MRLRVITASIFLLSLMTLPFIASANFPVSGSFVSLNSGVSESYDQFDDQVILVEAFATWCEPCKNEMYELSLIQDQFGDNITIVSLSVSPGTDNLDKIQTFKQKAEDLYDFTATWEFGLDRQREFSTEMNISVIPTTLLINEDGEVENLWEGVVTANKIGEYIDANVTFPEINQSEILLKQILNNSLFRVFSVVLFIMIVSKIVIPSNPKY